MKIALLGDSHFGANRASPITQTYFAKFYEFLFDYLDSNKITTLIQTGDLYDQRKDVHFTTLRWVNEHFYSKIESGNIDFYVIAGNHDCTYKNTNRINSVDLACTISCTKVTESPRTVIIGDKKFDFFPWICDENVLESNNLAKNTSSDYAVGHFEFAGFPMYPGSLAVHGASHKTFSKYKRVFSGHYHTISEIDNILYIGTPYELTWGDCSDNKGFWILDTDTDKLEYIKNPYNLYEKISYTDDVDYDCESVVDKYVKIIVREKINVKKFEKFLDKINSYGPLSVVVIEPNQAAIVDAAVSETELVSTHAMISSVIDNIDTPLDKDRLKKYMSNLYSDAIKITNSL